MFILTPFRGRSVMLGSSSTPTPGTRANRSRCARVASTSSASMVANALPMHMRGPPPKGRYAPRGGSLAKRWGSNPSGSSHSPGWRWTTYGLTKRIDRAGISYPAISSGPITDRTMVHAGGSADEVGEDHGHLAAVIAVDGAGAVQAGDPFPERKARTRPYLSFETRRDGDHQPRRHQRAFARRERNRGVGAQVQAGRSAGRVRRQRQRLAASWG